MLVTMFRRARDAVFRDLPWELLLVSPQNASVLVASDSVMRAWGVLLSRLASRSLGGLDFVHFLQDGALREDKQDTGTVVEALDADLPLDLLYHAFSSHKQDEAGDACSLIAEKLTGRGLKVWTVSMFKAVCMELDTALRAEKPILLVHESDPNRVGFAVFKKSIDTVLETAKHIFDVYRESIPFQRQLFLAESFYNESINRIDIT
ncbi:Hypothetical Protein FCC1311_092282 [Hondaea fermentalgiana]|uniref:Uncharacterized protein n=1 Tax=Hondaea fermentalgiana TaxID=2315210 RepID=A0A2R5GYE6_9STRA|nr:Hypothetical Protein FCC1311_092282 [Hondaea fermentalgiana]|eukprot:GBG33004.1 Hypothetical Protein FCC1311_092282 [Hondaea fermentalgiana]